MNVVVSATLHFPFWFSILSSGMAASNIEGNTLHSAFKFDFSHNYKSLSDKKRDELRNFFKNVEAVSYTHLTLPTKRIV